MSVRAQATKQALVEIVDEDARAFNRVIDALCLPRTNDAERHARDRALQDAYRRAAEVPLQAARLSLEVLELARVAALKARRDAASDAGTSALLARAAVEGAALNVMINLATLTDATFVRECRSEVDRLRARAHQLCDEIVDKIQSDFDPLGTGREVMS